MVRFSRFTSPPAGSLFLPDGEAGSPVFDFSSTGFDINFPPIFSAALSMTAGICLLLYRIAFPSVKHVVRRLVRLSSLYGSTCRGEPLWACRQRPVSARASRRIAPIAGRRVALVQLARRDASFA